MTHPTTTPRTARFCIWTLRFHELIAYHLRVYTWVGTILVLVLAVAGKIPLEVALNGIVIGLLSVSFLMWLLIRARRLSLLRIEDPELRNAAHEAMVDLIRRRHLSPAEKRLLRKHFGEHHCELGHCKSGSPLAHR